MLVEDVSASSYYELTEIRLDLAGQVVTGPAARTGRRMRPGCPGSPLPIGTEGLAGRLHGLLIKLEDRLREAYAS